jgi:hypothetical protein
MRWEWKSLPQQPNPHLHPEQHQQYQQSSGALNDQFDTLQDIPRYAKPTMASLLSATFPSQSIVFDYPHHDPKHSRSQSPPTRESPPSPKKKHLHNKSRQSMPKQSSKSSTTVSDKHPDASITNASILTTAKLPDLCLEDRIKIAKLLHHSAIAEAKQHQLAQLVEKTAVERDDLHGQLLIALDSVKNAQMEKEGVF